MPAEDGQKPGDEGEKKEEKEAVVASAEAAAKMKEEYEQAVVAAEKAKEAFWTRMKLGQSKGTGLFTIRARQLSAEEEDATGLICDYPYAGFSFAALPSIHFGA